MISLRPLPSRSIEKECLASVWACDRFEKYLCVLDEFKLVTDHKPLVPLNNNRSLMRFKNIAEYVPGKTLVVADTLSRSPQTAITKEPETCADVECYLDAVIQDISAMSHKINCIRNATTTDGVASCNKADQCWLATTQKPSSSSSQRVHSCKSRALRA